MKKITSFIFCYLLYGIHLVQAAEYKITQSLPCAPGADQSTCITATHGASQLGGIVGYAANLWSFGIAIGGVLALASIVYGAIEWTVSAGNESKISDAKDRITQAVIGLVLLFSAYTVLGFINPELTNLKHINDILSAVKEVPLAPAPTTGPSATTPTCDTCLGSFDALIDPVGLEDVVVRDALVDWCSGQPPPLSGECYINGKIAVALSTIKAKGALSTTDGVPIWEVTEAWPPLGDFTEHCHNITGTCADLDIRPRFIDFANGVGCEKVAQLIQAAKNAGLTVRNEYPACPGGQQTEFDPEGHGHIHVSVSGGGGGQSSTSGGSASCNDPQALAAQYNEPYEAKKSAELDTLISCVKGKLSGQDLKSEFTFENSNKLCNYTRGDTMCGACQHAKNSCHYGGKTGTDGAMAVDFGNEAIGEQIIQAAIACGINNNGSFPKARCEDEKGKIVTPCSGTSENGLPANHVHISSQNCDAN